MMRVRTVLRLVQFEAERDRFFLLFPILAVFGTPHKAESAAVGLGFEVGLWMVLVLGCLTMAPLDWTAALRHGDAGDVHEFLFTRAVAKRDCYWAKLVLLCGVSAWTMMPAMVATLRRPSDLLVTTTWQDHQNYLKGMAGSVLARGTGPGLAQAPPADGRVDVLVPLGRQRVLAFELWSVAFVLLISQLVAGPLARSRWLIRVMFLAVLIAALVLSGPPLASRLRMVDCAADNALFLFDRHRLFAVVFLAAAAPLLLHLGRRRFEQMEVV